LAVIYEIRLTFGGRLAAELGWRRVRARESGCFAVQIIAQRRQRIDQGDKEHADREGGVLETVHILNAVQAKLSGGFEYLLDSIELLNSPISFFR
jgi:hypothetical protein